jgi:serine/threonine-protein kinase
MTHGDIKPSNIFLSPQGHVTLIDLGFARATGEPSNAALRPTLCSLAYAAPETVTSALAANVRSDIYSLGMSLYEMLTGQLPYDASDPVRLVEMLRTTNPVCIRQLRPDLPRPVASLVHRMLARQPLRRPQTHGELIEQLVRLEVECFANR